MKNFDKFDELNLNMQLKVIDKNKLNGEDA